MNAMAQRLRELLQRDEMICAPGCYDAITGRAIQRNGFELAYMSGGGTSFAHGYPDYGLITMTEMVDNAGRIASALDIPVICDADTGYGNALNVVRTVREFEMRGVAGLHIEDQVTPKRCGHIDGKELISREDYVQKIRAAVAARRDPNFVIIARTDSRGVTGFEDAIGRANAALAAGADIAFVEELQTLEEVEAAPRLLNGPALYNIVWNGKSPNVPSHAAAAMGYKVAIAPGLLLRSVMLACDANLQAFASTGEFPPIDRHWGVADTFAFNGAAKWDELSQRFAEAPKGAEEKLAS
jgi:2-methylisocitrate lyase-like PEP mutase family enzyme